MSEKKYTQEDLDAAISKEVEGLKNKRDELLSTVTSLKSQISETNKKFDGLDVDALKELAKTAKTQQEKELLDSGKVDQLLQIKIEEAIAPYKAQIDASKQELDSLVQERDKIKSDFTRTTTENFIRSVASKVPDLHKSAVDDLVLRGLNSARDVDGSLQFFNGDAPIMKDGKPIDGAQWVEGMRDTHPHYFNIANGSSPNGGADGGVNLDDYFNPKSKNYSVTKQAEIAKSNPGKYETLSSKYDQGS